MKSKKVTMLAAALVVAVVALAGIGYATTFTAQTTNDGNTAKATYLLIDQGTEATAYGGDWLTNVYFDTVNTAHDANTYTMKKEYKDNAGAIAKTAEGPTLALISDILSISVTGHNSTENELTIKVTTTNLTTTSKVAGLEYYLAIGDATTSDQGVISMTGATLVQGVTDANGTTWTLSHTATNGSTTFDLLMFIGGEATADPGDYAGLGATSSFVITASADQ